MMQDYSLEWVDKYFVGGVPEIQEWFLVKTYKLTFSIVVAYVLVVKLIGPAVMRNRKPLNLRPLMVVYNFGLVAAYVYLLIKGFNIIPLYGLEFFCGKAGESGLALVHTDIVPLGYYVYIMKHIELLDTVFLVATKKFHMITPLHVIHHSSLPIAGFIFFRMEKSTYIGVYAYANGIVHVIMYSYYGLAALGPKYQKYLWWKKYLTMLQIVQFVFMSVYMAVMWYAGCMSSRLTPFLTVSMTLLFLWMFLKFYRASFQKNVKRA